jgi:5-formyltetrahydrofolate cyclo-ligase
VGLAFDMQVVASVPHGARDEPMDAVVTDARILRR